MRKLILFFLFLPTLLWAQNYELGEIIVKLKKQENPQLWLERVSQVNQIPTGLQLKKSVSKPFDLYLCTFNRNQWSEKDLISALKQDYLVVEAQVNHIIKSRLVPNDNLYSSQWQYNNTGQNGGLPGADIDIEGAWEETTGGLTVDGDTIVVCVIDGGFELSHQDLAPNMWVNHAEIPNNGIDDDSNGYVDDYRGWNADNNNDNIVPNNSHGTPVAAIVGAKGNDSTGVAGVNWDVKIMGVSGGGNEAEALAAYTYPYVARKRYNQTNGAEGAFVVATNASWGVDYGQAADAPLWCAFYDSLGAVGILNAGATINGNVNVDIQGDLPTQCSSEYLISVTNMNNQDVKVTGAGYGSTSIDMGAFGAGTYTAESGNSYGSFGGTSGATPHVAGTIALLYSAECSSFIDLAKQNPAGAALLIKEYIYEGLDPNASLQGITSQEGRLNVNSSMQLMLSECSSCASVQELSATVDNQNATISWVDTSNAETRIIYQKDGQMDWDTVFNTTTPYTIDSLDICSEYRIKVQNLCEDSTWATSPGVIVESGNCCYVADFEEVSSEESNIELQWASTLNADAYTLFYRLDGATNWIDSITVGGTATSIGLSDLEPCSTYELKLRSQCPEISQEETIYVETEGCGKCTELTYCEADVFNANSSHISQVSSLNFVKNSSAGIDGYQNFQGTSQFLLTKAVSNHITVTTQSSDPGYDAKLWVDFDANGEFDTYEIFDGDQSGNIFEFEVEVPTQVFSQITRMRIVYQYRFGSTQLVPCNSTAFFRVGEVEDYCVRLIDPVSTVELSEEEVDVYPNPVSDVLHVNNHSQQVLNLQIVDVLGKVIKKQTLSEGHHEQIDVSELPVGLYILEYSGDQSQLFRKKFIKQ